MMNDRTLERLRSFYRKKRALIPGGAGFIGSHIAKSLVCLGSRVTIADSLPGYCGGNTFNISTIRHSARFSRKKAEDFIRTDSPDNYDIIFNCVGLTSHYIGLNNVELDYKINCESGLRILEWSSKAGHPVTIVSIGSRSQYGKADGKRFDEKHPLDPIDIQALHKTTLEYYHRIFSLRYGMQTICARLTNVYGPGQRLHGDVGLVGEFILGGLSHDKILVYGSPDRLKDVLFVTDAVNAMLLVAAKGGRVPFEVFNVGGAPCAIGKLAGLFGAETKTPVRLEPFSHDAKKINTGDVILDIKKIRDRTGWVPEVLAEAGVAATMDYYNRFKKYYLKKG